MEQLSAPRAYKHTHTHTHSPSESEWAQRVYENCFVCFGCSYLLVICLCPFPSLWLVERRLECRCFGLVFKLRVLARLQLVLIPLNVEYCWMFNAELLIWLITCMAFCVLYGLFVQVSSSFRYFISRWLCFFSVRSRLFCFVLDVCVISSNNNNTHEKISF